MFTAHVHIIPDYKTGSSWIPNVPHGSDDAIFNSADRSDVEWPGLEGVQHFRIQATDRIGLLMDYIVRWYRNSDEKSEEEARCLGILIVEEIKRLGMQKCAVASSLPEELNRLVMHIDTHYMHGLTLAELAEMIGRSRSHVLKLFKTHLNVSAKGYIIQKQFSEACELLLSSTKSIAEIGQAVGIADPYHFSKLFRRYNKVSPTVYRMNHGPVGLTEDAS